MVKKHLSEIVSIINPIENIYTVELQSLSGRFKYFPGQFLHLALDSDYDGIGQWPDSRCFSMQSNPSEKILRITYAVKGRFTGRMREELHPGRKVWLKLPYGDLFTQPHNKTNTVFIAGGTGITPFLSLFTHDAFREYINPQIYLGFKTKAHNVYEDALMTMHERNPSLVKRHARVCYEASDGIIDIERIACENSASSTYFISGPPEMIKSFKNHLKNKKISENQILTDDWL